MQAAFHLPAPRAPLINAGPTTKWRVDRPAPRAPTPKLPSPALHMTSWDLWAGPHPAVHALLADLGRRAPASSEALLAALMAGDPAAVAAAWQKVGGLAPLRAQLWRRCPVHSGGPPLLPSHRCRRAGRAGHAGSAPQLLTSPALPVVPLLVLRTFLSGSPAVRSQPQASAAAVLGMLLPCYVSLLRVQKVSFA